MERRENDRMFFEELKQLQDKITDKFDDHAKDEMQHHRNTEERLASVEANLGIMTDYVKKVTEILERITVIEERDKNRNLVLGQLSESINEMKRFSENSEEKIRKVDERLKQWIYTFSGGVIVLVMLWNIFSNSIESKLASFGEIAEKTKIHLEVDKPVGWAPAHSIKP